MICGSVDATFHCESLLFQKYQLGLKFFEAVGGGYSYLRGVCSG